MTNAETNTGATGGEDGAAVALEKTSSKKPASHRKGAPKGRKTATGDNSQRAKKKKAQAGKKTSRLARGKDAGTPRPSKGAKILELIGRPKGA